MTETSKPATGLGAVLAAKKPPEGVNADKTQAAVETGLTDSNERGDASNDSKAKPFVTGSQVEGENAERATPTVDAETDIVDSKFEAGLTTQGDEARKLSDEATDANRASTIIEETRGLALAAETAQEFEGKIYTCLPIQNWQVGRFKFRDGQLHLTDQESITDFEKMVSQMPQIDRIRIKSVDMDLARRIAEDAAPRATRGMDGGHSAQEDELRRTAVRTGTQQLGTKESGN